VTRNSDWAAYLALAATFAIVWIIQHGYGGLVHDSQIYTLPAAARVHPDLLGNDIMLRFGSQDSFSIFSALYATAIRVLGVEYAAAVLTFISQLGFLLASAALARKLLPGRLAWLGLALVFAVPGFYGSRGIFSVVEDFASPRLAAEAFVLAGLTALLSGRLWLAASLALAAALLHPLMAAAGVVVALLMNPTLFRRRAWIVAAAAGCGVAVLLISVVRGSHLRFDAEWLRLIETGTDYLFVTHWAVGSWARTAVMLATLLVGAAVLEPSPARSLCVAAFFAAVIGLVASFVGGDLLHIVLVVQVQLWRWNWIVSLLAALLLPLIVIRAWSRGPVERSMILLLGSAWLCMTEVYALEILLLLAPLWLIVARRSVAVPAHVARQIFLGTCALTALAALYHVATGILFANVVPDQSDAPAVVKSIRALSRTGALPWAIFLVVFVLVIRVRAQLVKAAAGVVSVAVLLSLVPVSLHEWTARYYGPHTSQAFESWRAQIPVGSEVLWFDAPLATWLLLERPSYLSNQQESQGLFSRPAAMAMKARVDALGPFLDTEVSVGWSDRRQPASPAAAPPVALAALCAAAPDVKYVVTRKDMAATPIATTPADVPAMYKGVQLYVCPESQG
jgi:hypothetical protein